MKKIKPVLLILASLFILWALTWPSSCKVVLEFENNLNNTGSGSYTFTSTAPFSTAQKELGTYSIGPITSQPMAVYSSGAVNEVIQKFQTWIYPLSSQPTIGIIWSNQSTATVYFYGGPSVNYYDPIGGQIGPFGMSFNAGHVMIVTWDGTGSDLYIDSVHEGRLANADQPTNYTWTFGARNSGEYCNCYFDDLILSTDNSTAGSEITPIPPTPTYTWTLSSTPTYTWTLTPTPTYTWTLTPTPTYTWTLTPTPTYTKTPTFTVTPTWTNSPVASATSTPIPNFTQTPPTGNRLVGFRVVFSNGKFIVSMIGSHDFDMWYSQYLTYGIVKPSGVDFIPLYQ